MKNLYLPTLVDFLYFTKNKIITAFTYLSAIITMHFECILQLFLIL